MGNHDFDLASKELICSLVSREAFEDCTRYSNRLLLAICPGMIYARRQTFFDSVELVFGHATFMHVLPVQDETDTRSKLSTLVKYQHGGHI